MFRLYQWARQDRLICGHLSSHRLQNCLSASSAASGLQDCEAGQTCILNIDGIPFSDTFTGIAIPGYRFFGWQGSHRSLCGGKATPCVLQGISASATALSVEPYLLPQFEPNVHRSCWCDVSGLSRRHAR